MKHYVVEFTYESTTTFTSLSNIFYISPEYKTTKDIHTDEIVNTKI